MSWLVLIAIAAIAYWFWARQRAEPQPQPRREAAPQPAQGDRDAWEGSFWEASQAVNYRYSVRFSYEDANGSRTQREVDIRAFEPFNAKGLVIGHCKLRDATRTFRYDRIRDCVALETGEVIRDLRTHLLAERNNSPEGVADKVVNEHRDVLKILLFMAKADGQMRAAEVAVIAAMCRDLTKEPRVDEETVKCALQSCDVMTPRGFSLACNAMAREKPELFERCRVAAQEVVNTQKTVHPMEKAALEMMAAAAAKQPA